MRVFKLKMEEPEKTLQQKREEFQAIPRDPIIYKCYKENDLTAIKHYYENTMPHENRGIILTNALWGTLIFNRTDIIENGDYAMVQWLAQLPEVNVYFEDDCVFRYLCTHGILPLAKWFVEHFDDIDIHAQNEEAFREACTGGHFETAKWLYSLGEVDIHAEEDDAFVMSCDYGYLEIAQWLFSLGGVDIFTQNGIIFNFDNFDNEYESIYDKANRAEVMMWLHEIKNNNLSPKI